MACQNPLKGFLENENTHFEALPSREFLDLRQQVCELQALTPEQGHITRFWSQGTQKNQTLQADTLAPGTVSNGQQQLLLCAGAAFSRALGSCLHDAEQANRASKPRVRDMSLSAPTKAKFSNACNLLSTRLTPPQEATGLQRQKGLLWVCKNAKRGMHACRI